MEPNPIQAHISFCSLSSPYFILPSRLSPLQPSPFSHLTLNIQVFLCSSNKSIPLLFLANLATHLPLLLNSYFAYLIRAVLLASSIWVKSCTHFQCPRALQSRLKPPWIIWNFFFFFTKKTWLQKCSGLLLSPSTHFCKSAVTNRMGFPNSGDNLLKTIAFWNVTLNVHGEKIWKVKYL